MKKWRVCCPVWRRRSSKTSIRSWKSKRCPNWIQKSKASLLDKFAHWINRITESGKLYVSVLKKKTPTGFQQNCQLSRKNSAELFKKSSYYPGMIEGYWYYLSQKFQRIESYGYIETVYFRYADYGISTPGDKQWSSETNTDSGRIIVIPEWNCRNCWTICPTCFSQQSRFRPALCRFDHAALSLKCCVLFEWRFQDQS